MNDMKDQYIVSINPAYEINASKKLVYILFCFALIDKPEN